MVPRVATILILPPTLLSFSIVLWRQRCQEDQWRRVQNEGVGQVTSYDITWHVHAICIPRFSILSDRHGR